MIIQDAFKPFSALFDKEISAYGFSFLKNLLFNLIFGMGKKAIMAKFKIKPVCKKCPGNGGFVIATRTIRETKYGHCVRVDPLLFRV